MAACMLVPEEEEEEREGEVSTGVGGHVPRRKKRPT